jgi:hypothetical protein
MSSQTVDTPQDPLDEPNFHESMDARDWARAFVAHVTANPAIATDEGAMIGWFANAIMRGYDTARAKYESGPKRETD